MADQHRPEVNLEINSGFFRIPTREMVYNITVIADNSGIPIVERIVEVEKRTEAAGNSGGLDPFYQQVSQQTLATLAGLGRDLGRLTKAPASGTGKGTITRILGEARTALAGLKEIAAVPASPGGGETGADFASLLDKLQQAKAMLGGSPSGTDAAPVQEDTPPAAAAATGKRYLFDLDVVFQTLYELCTNETVKTHISKARENRETFFDKSKFLDIINEKIAGLEADGDNFFNVPMSDVLTSLLETCTEKPIQNLLKKMDSNQGSIFLDSILPLEVPAFEEGEAKAAEEGESSDSESTESMDENSQVNDIQAGEASALLDEALLLVEAMAGSTAGGVTRTDSGSEEFNARIDQLEALLESALADNGGEDGQEEVGEALAGFRQRLLEAVLTLQEEIRLKKENVAVSADEAAKQAAAVAGRKAAGVKSQQDLERLLGEVGL